MSYPDARTWRPAGRFAHLLLTAAVFAATCGRAAAVEPAEEFLNGLEQRGLNDLALDYLDSLESSGTIDDEFRRKIPYHRGVVLIEQSRRTMEPETRSRLLDEARAELERFGEANPGSVLAAAAQLQLANVQMAQGQQVVSQMSQLPAEAAYEARRKSLGRDARELFAGAREMFQDAEATYSKELEKLPPSTKDARDDTGNARQEYRARVAQLRFLAAQALFEAAQTYAPEADEFAQLNEEAAAEFAIVYDEFARAFIVGLYARLYEGRCYQALGDHQLALGCFGDILEQPNVLPPFRKLIASAVHRKAEVHIAQEKFDQAIEACNICLRDAKADEQKQPEWLAVRFRLAEAMATKAEAIGPNTLDGRKLLAEARDAYRLVARVPNEFQSAARLAVAMIASGEEDSKERPRMFQAAYDLGKEALASYNAAKLAMPSAESNNPDALPELKQQMEQGKEDARRYFRAASTLVDDDTDPKLVNEVRYFLCWLYWESGDYYRAAVLGEFLARRYPDHPAAASAAKLAMASYERLYSRATEGGGDAEFEARRMADIAEFVVRRWPGTGDADAAQSVLVSFAIRSNRIEEAEKLLAAASPETRPQLELQLGNAMWARYLELSQANGQQAVPDTAALDKLKVSAAKYLRSGLESARKQWEPSETAAAASLYLVQVLLSDENYAEAIELLEDKKIGPLELVSRKHPAASRPQYLIEAYKAALRAYVLSSPPQEKKALAIMKSLDKAVEASGGGGDQLTQIYIGLGVALADQAKQLREAGRAQDATRINTAFAQFLDRIAERREDTNWATRVWLAQTYQDLGASPSAAAPTQLTDDARKYLAKARDSYEALLADAEMNPELPPGEISVLAVRMRLGECLRELGQYKEALDVFSSILKEKEASLAVQRAAAKTYQERGQAENAKWLEYAIRGGHRLKSTGQNRIWGWLKISQVAARAARSNPKYRDAFYEARANIARCRYLAAMKESGAARKQNLAKAKQGIQSLAQLYPEMGGPKWRGEFDALLKQIQKAAGEKASGLSEFSASGAPADSGRSG